jgi:N utilization substance protein A
MVINALQPAKIESIVLDEQNHSMELAVNEDNLALAIGARGQNIRLASRLVGWELNIISSEEAEAKEKLIETEFQAKLIDSLSISENEAELLVEAGMKSFDEIAYAEEKDLKALLDRTDEKIEELKTAASDAALIEAMGEFSAEEDELASLNDLGLSTEDIDSLKLKKIKNKDDIAELSVDELKDLIVIDDKKAAEIIMKAREGWFK